MEISITQSKERSVDIIEELCSVWEGSVRATHHFLTEEDIKNLRPVVEEGLKEIPILGIAVSCAGRTVGFIGIAGKKVEMLFVVPKYIGTGIGHSLIAWAVTNHHICYIDVNEQNDKATAIYKHWGFDTYERTDFDDQGNPFPILKMRLNPNRSLGFLFAV